jgi:Tfp pilus assembly protein PilO
VTAPRGLMPFWRRRLLPPVVALLALNGLAFAAYTLPRALQVRNTTARATALREEIAKQRRITAAIVDQAGAIRANAAETDRFYKNVIVANRVELLPLIEDIEKMAAEPGLKAGPRSYALEPVKGAPITRVQVGLSLQGSYDQLVAFLDRVERSPRFLIVDRIALTSGTGHEGNNLRVEVSAFLHGKEDKVARRGR